MHAKKKRRKNWAAQVKNWATFEVGEKEKKTEKKRKERRKRRESVQRRRVREVQEKYFKKKKILPQTVECGVTFTNLR